MANSALVKAIMYKSLAEGVYKDVVSRSSSFYYFLGKTLSWDDENVPPYPIDSYEYERDVRNEIITIKEIKPSDVAFVIPRRDWISDIIYDMYDDQYSDQLIGINIVSGGTGYIDPTSVNITITGGGADTTATAVCQEIVDGQISKVTLTYRGTGYTSIPTITVTSPSGAGAELRAVVGIASSGAQRLEDANFYVVTDEYNVYKCLDNNNNARSKNKPTGTQLEPIKTLDGYIWKFMYNIPINLRNKFYTDEYIPVVSALTNQFYSNGTIDNIFIANKGEKYTTANITVDGDGYREADPIYIDSINVDLPGTGYTNPTIDFSAPVGTSSTFIAGSGVNLGQTIFNSSSYDYYEVITPGTLSSTAPTHKYGTVLNGTAALKYVGSKLKGTVELRNDKDITRVDVISGGTGYTSSPAVTIVDSTGANASATADIGTSSIISVQVASGGSGFTTNPTLTVVSPTGTGTQLQAYVVNGVIDHVVVIQAGSGYVEVPQIVVSGGGGSGAVLEAVLSGSPVLSISVVNGGNGYSSPYDSSIGVGTISVTQGTKTVTGYSSIFETQILPNQILKNIDGDYIGVVESITSNTSITLRNNSPITTNHALYKVWSGPTVYINGGGGLGATADAIVETGVVDKIVLDGSIREVIISNPGKGYITAPEVVVGVPVESVTVTDGGYGYSTPPEIILNDGGGSNAIAHSELQDGLITDITINNAGSNYGVPPIVSINDPTGLYATAEAVLSGSPILTTVIQNGGSGYITTPSLTFTAPEAVGGVTATASAVLSGAGVTDVYVTNQGNGYTSYPDVELNTALGDSGTGATAEAILSGSAVTSINVTAGGTGYTLALVTFSLPENLNGIRAEGTAIIAGGSVTGITLTNAGSGYVAPPSVSITGTGSGATATCTVNASKVIGFNITNAGSGYKVPPIAAITGGGGSNAAAGVTIGTSSIVGINVSNYGSGYTSPPVVIVGDPDTVNGVSATVTATIGKSTISSINVTSKGSGYTNPSVVITTVSGDTGSGATATATHKDGVITRIVVDAGGNGYYQSPDVYIVGDGHEGAATANLLSGRSAVVKSKLYEDKVVSTIVFDPGEHYSIVPTITFGTQFEKGLNVFTNEQYVNGNYLYTVVEWGVLGSKAPTHISGIEISSDVWEANTAVSFNETVYIDDRLYEVMTSGTTGSSAPTHTSGSVLNGTAYLKYLGKPASLKRAGDAAQGRATMRYGAGYSVTPSATITDPTGNSAEISFRTSTSTAKISPIIEDGQITFLVVEDPGIGYTKATLNVSGSGTGAYLVPDLSLGNVSSQQANNEILTPAGTIDAISVVSGGYSYGVANVIIEGDGTGATAEAEIDPVTNAITKIHIINRGQDYTFANVKVIGNETGNGAVLRAIISPYGGHGKNCPEEFFSRHLMFYSNISTDLNQGVIVGNDYRQVGIIKNPRIMNAYQRFQGSIGSACFLVQSPIDVLKFAKDDELYIERVTTPDIQWEPSLDMTLGQFVWYENRIYTVIVSGLGASYPPSSTTGVEINGSAVLTYVGSTHSQKRYRIVSVSSKSALVQSLDNDVPKSNDIFIKTNSINDKFTAVTVGLPNFDKYSGQMMYIDNKQGFTPSGDETITLRTIIKF